MPERRFQVDGASTDELVDGFADAGLQDSESAILRITWLYYSAAASGAVRVYFGDPASPTAADDQIEIVNETLQYSARFCYPVPRNAGGTPYSMYITKADTGQGWLRYFWSVNEESNYGG